MILDKIFTEALAEVLKRENVFLKAFRSGGGLMVVRIEEDCGVHEDNIKLGYGEHPMLFEAILHAVEDVIDGILSYKEKYSYEDSKYPHYLTGSYEFESIIESHILQGEGLKIHFVDGNFEITLEGHEHLRVPKEIQDYLIYRAKTGHSFKMMHWMSQGIIKVSKAEKFADGQWGVSSQEMERTPDAIVYSGLPQVIRKYQNPKLELAFDLFSLHETEFISEEEPKTAEA
jgi:hypothetical protein